MASAPFYRHWILVVLAAACAAQVDAREGFPADKKGAELDFPYGPNVRPYVNGVLFQSAVTFVFVVTAFTLVILCAGCCVCCCVRRIPPSPQKAESMRLKSGRALNPKLNTYGVMYVACLVLATLMLGCAVWATLADEKVDEGLNSGHDETTAFFSRLGTSMCAEDRSKVEQRDCDGASVYAFLNSTRAHGEFAFDHVLAAIIFVELVDTYLTSEGEALNSIASSVDSVQDDLMPTMDTAKIEIEELLTWLNDSSVTGDDLSGLLPHLEDLPTLADTDDRLLPYGECDAYSAGVRQTKTLLDPSIEPLQQAVSLIQPYKRDIDRDPHNSDTDIRGAVLDNVLTEALDEVVEVNKAVLGVRDDVRQGEESLEDGQDSKTVSLQLYFFIPAMIQLVSLGVAYCRGKPYPLGINVCFTCCTLLVYVIIALLVAFTAVIVNDFCDSHEEFIVTQTGGAEFTFEDVTVDVSSSVINLLHCDTVDDTSPENYPWATPSNNYVDIWGLQDVFDVSEYTQDLEDALEESTTLLDLIDWSSLKEFGRFIPRSDPTEGLVTDEGNVTRFQEDVGELVTFVNSGSFDVEVVAQVGQLNATTITFLDAFEKLQYVSEVTPHVRGNYTQSVDNAEQATDAAGDELDEAVDDLQRLVELVAETRNYALCGYVGVFYENGVEEAGCEDFRDGLDLLWMPLVLIIILMDLSCISIIRGFVFARRHFTEEDFREFLRVELGPSIADHLPLV